MWVVTFFVLNNHISASGTCQKQIGIFKYFASSSQADKSTCLKKWVPKMK